MYLSIYLESLILPLVNDSEADPRVAGASSPDSMDAPGGGGSDGLMGTPSEKSPLMLSPKK